MEKPNLQKSIEILKNFVLDGKINTVQPYGEGHINTTYLVVTDKKNYILQKINTTVFPDTEALMNNICAVTQYLRDKGIETLTVVPTVNGTSYFTDESGKWRVCDFIENSVTYQSVISEEMFKKVGNAFGKFQNHLAGFDATLLKETIPHFHDTPLRVEAFKKAVSVDKCGRVKDGSCKDEIDFVLSNAYKLGTVAQALQEGRIPLRVTHNDTKLNNILMDAETNEPKAVIDLDTVMPGSLLYDFGDSIRFGASTAAEDEKDLEKVHFSLSYFKAYAEGYLVAVKSSITEAEKNLLPYSAYLMMMECGIRFLTDYLSGDIYFKIKYPEHNLVRAKTQFKLAQETENSFGLMQRIISEN